MISATSTLTTLPALSSLTAPSGITLSGTENLAPSVGDGSGLFEQALQAALSPFTTVPQNLLQEINALGQPIGAANGEQMNGSLRGKMKQSLDAAQLLELQERSSQMVVGMTVATKAVNLGIKFINELTHLQ